MPQELSPNPKQMNQLDQSQSLLDHQPVVSKLSVDVEMSQFKYQDLSKCQIVYQSQKPIVSQLLRLFLGPQLVTTNQDKYATKCRDKCHSKYLLKNVPKLQNKYVKMFLTSQLDKYAKQPTKDLMDMDTNMDMDTDTESIIKLK